MWRKAYSRCEAMEAKNLDGGNVSAGQEELYRAMPVSHSVPTAPSIVHPIFFSGNSRRSH
jgi:hypothetical protein